MQFSPRRVQLYLALTVLLTLPIASLSLIASAFESKATSILASQPSGYFTLLSPGSALPSDEECAARVHLSSWEPRPDNAVPNHRVPTAVQLSGIASWAGQWFASDPRADGFRQRITGHFTGTTDEILQWAACKWGWDDNMLRAQAVGESHWYQNDVGDYTTNHGLCPPGRGYPGAWNGTGCYQSYSILQIKNTSFPSLWPMTKDDTAFAVDFALAWTRLCYEGWAGYLSTRAPTAGYPSYHAGDAWGCIGRYYSGSWYDPGAINYIQSVKNHLANQDWNKLGAGPLPTPQPQSTWRIEAGGTSNYTDTHGKIWLSDRGFVGGQTVNRGNIAIGKTTDPKIYQSEHYGMRSASYPVPNGTYTVKLHFAETFAGITGPSQRVFSVNVQGSAMNNLDVYREAGGRNIALVRTVLVTVTNGWLTITFTPQRENPEINGIEILPRAAT